MLFDLGSRGLENLKIDDVVSTIFLDVMPF
jgi:hypothetical protein